MKSLLSVHRRLRASRKGAGLVEYGVVVGLVSVLAIGSVLSLGERVESTYCTVVDTLGGSQSGFTDDSCGAFGAPMVLEVSVAAGEQVDFIFGSSGDSIDIAVDWGDESAQGRVDAASSAPAPDRTATHTYTEAGTYTIRLAGEATFFRSLSPDSLVAVRDWGELGLTSLWNAFSGHTVLASLPGDLPDGVTTIQLILDGATANPSGMSSWDVRNVEHMGDAFRNAVNFDQDLSSWRPESVRFMPRMFQGASAFTSDLSAWNVGNAEETWQMFQDASSFNADLSNWDVSEVTDMNGMFRDATSFSSDLSGWCVDDILSAPVNFSVNTASVIDPVWSSCP